MIETTTLKTDVEQEFEGGNSLSIDWDSHIRRAVENVMDNVRPETGKRRVPIYGGLAQDLYSYYCPTDVLVPSDLYDNEGQLQQGAVGSRKFSYVPPKQFYAQQRNNTYTIEYINGVQFLVVRHNKTTSSLTIEAMDEVGTTTGTVTPTLNEHDFLSGGASLQAIFTDAGLEWGKTFTTAKDITNYLKGTLIAPCRFSTSANIASVQFRLKTDDSNYYKVISTSDSIGDYFVDGWNMVRFNMANATQVGTPTASNITKFSVIVTTDTGTTETVIFDKVTLHQSAVYYLEYYSNKLFIDGSDGSWKSTCSVATNDQIRLNRDLAGILHYELCLLIVQSSTFDAVDGQATKRFEGQLSRKYQAYWDNHPSSEAPLTYSKSPEIDINIDTAFGRLQDDTESIDE